MLSLALCCAVPRLAGHVLGESCPNPVFFSEALSQVQRGPVSDFTEYRRSLPRPEPWVGSGVGRASLLTQSQTHPGDEAKEAQLYRSGTGPRTGEVWGLPDSAVACLQDGSLQSQNTGTHPHLRL